MYSVLNLPDLSPELGWKLPSSVNSQSIAQLVIVNGGVEAVVGVPLLCQAESVLLDLVLGLQAACHLSSISRAGAPSTELHATAGLGLDIQLDKPKVVSLSKHIPGLFANIGVGRRSHGVTSVSCRSESSNN